MGAETAERRERVLAALVEAGDAGVSGEALAEALGTSRASVHRHVEGLRRDGLDVRSAHDGYRLGEGDDPVVPLLVAPRLRPPLAGPVTWLAQTGSTNEDLIAPRARGRPGGHRGRGRHPDRRARAGAGAAGWPRAATACWCRCCCAPGVPAGQRRPAADRGRGGRGRGARARCPHRVAQRHPHRRPQGGRASCARCRPTRRAWRGRWSASASTCARRPSSTTPAGAPAPCPTAAIRRPRADLLVGLLAALGDRYAGWVADGPRRDARRLRRARRPGGPRDHGQPARGRGVRGRRGHRRARAPARAHRRGGAAPGRRRGGAGRALALRGGTSRLDAALEPGQAVVPGALGGRSATPWWGAARPRAAGSAPRARRRAGAPPGPRPGGWPGAWRPPAG